MKKIEIKKINFFLIIKYLYPVTIFLIIITLFFLGKFLYNNVYQTIIQAELITDLRKEISDQNLERAKFEQITKNIELKGSSEITNTQAIKDPFQNFVVTPPVTKP
jgi:predicted KAP-like P-loop ATPase